MPRHSVLRRTAPFGAVVTVSLLALVAAQAQTVPVATPVALPSASAAAAPVCNVTPGQARFDMPLPRIARLIASGAPIKIVALGSSSTFGAGASSSAAAYPSRLAEELARHFPGQKFTVLNRGVNGEEAADMLARLETAVIAERPDLVLWQAGTNLVLRDKAVSPYASLLHEGLIRLKAIGADIVLIDPQYAPRVLAKPNIDGVVSLMATTAKAENVSLFHRFALMRHWYEDEHLPFETFVSADGLHMNDWSYACLAKGIATAIVEAATRPTATAGGPPVRR
jgi:lysophospholipase L1-like esterase